MITRRKLLKGLLSGAIALPLSLAGKDNDKPTVLRAEIVSDTIFHGPVTIVSENATLANSVVHGPVTIDCDKGMIMGNFVQVKPGETGITNRGSVSLGSIGYGAS